jgi:hypothetical protein
MAYSLIPKSKLDLDTANHAVAVGYPGVEPILGDLVEWLQDYNWPVARVLAPFLAGIGKPLVPHIDHVFSTTDGTWKYWMIVCLISNSDDLFEHYKQKLIQYREQPTDDGRHDELDEVARDVLVERGF